MDLKTILLKFKDATVALIKCIEAEDYDSLQGFLNERQALIDTLDNITYDKQLFNKLCNDYEISNLNSKMNAIMTEKLNNVKSEIKKIDLQRNVNSNYNKINSVDSIFFNKKI